jgi:ribosomal protein L40E
LRGVKKIERVVSEQILEPKVCFKCGERNPFDGLFCVKCSTPLSREGAEQVLKKDELLELLGDPELNVKLKQFLQRLKDGKE